MISWRNPPRRARYDFLAKPPAAAQHSLLLNPAGRVVSFTHTHIHLMEETFLGLSVCNHLHSCAKFCMLSFAQHYRLCLPNHPAPNWLCLVAGTLVAFLRTARGGCHFLHHNFFANRAPTACFFFPISQVHF